MIQPTVQCTESAKLSRLDFCCCVREQLAGKQQQQQEQHCERVLWLSALSLSLSRTSAFAFPSLPFPSTGTSISTAISISSRSPRSKKPSANGVRARFGCCCVGRLFAFGKTGGSMEMEWGRVSVCGCECWNGCARDSLPF